MERALPWLAGYPSVVCNTNYNLLFDFILLLRVTWNHRSHLAATVAEQPDLSAIRRHTAAPCRMAFLSTTLCKIFRCGLCCVNYAVSLKWCIKMYFYKCVCTYLTITVIFTENELQRKRSADLCCSMNTAGSGTSGSCIMLGGSQMHSFARGQSKPSGEGGHTSSFLGVVLSVGMAWTGLPGSPPSTLQVGRGRNGCFAGKLLLKQRPEAGEPSQM